MSDTSCAYYGTLGGSASNVTCAIATEPPVDGPEFYEQANTPRREIESKSRQKKQDSMKRLIEAAESIMREDRDILHGLEPRRIRGAADAADVVADVLK